MRADRTNWIGVAFGLLLAIFAAFQFFKLPPLLPVLLERYGYDRTLAGGFMSVYAITGLAVSLYLGRLIERQGVVRPVLVGLALMAAGNLLSLLRPEIGYLVLTGRGLEGLGFAALAIAGPTLVNTSASVRQLPLLAGLSATWIPIGQIAASLSAPVFLWLGGWQGLWIFAALLCAGLAGLTLWAAARGQLPQPAAPNPGVPAAAARPPGEGVTLWLAALVFVLWAAQYFAFMTWLPQYLVEAHGLGLNLALAGYLLPVLVLILFAIITGVLLRAGAPLALMLAGALSIQVVVWFWHPSAGQPVLGTIALVAYGIGAGITPACLFAMPSAITTRQRAASALGILMTGRNVGVLIGPVLLAKAFELSGGWSLAGPLFGSCTALCLVAALTLGWRLKAPGGTRPAQ